MSAVLGRDNSGHYSNLRQQILKTVSIQLNKEAQLLGSEIPRRFKRSQTGEVFEG